MCSQNEIIQLGCWAHASREFTDAIESQGKLKPKKTSLAATGLKRIQYSYAVVKQAKHYRHNGVKNGVNLDPHLLDCC